MKKMIFLMLLLITLGAASMNAQVAIGAGTGVDNGPHTGAVLELDGSKGGLLLPKVSITDSGTFQLAGNEEDGIGMLVYNTNEAITDGYGKGVYVWDGENWNIVNRQGGFDNEFNPGDYGTGTPVGVTSAGLNGVTCFDVTTDIGPSSGYSFAIAPTNIIVTSVVWEFADPYKVLRDPNPSSSGTAGATLYFKSNTAIGAIIDENPSDNVTVTLTAYVTLNNATRTILTKTVKFQKESCCADGMLIPNGVWAGPADTNLGGGNSLAFSVVDDYFTQTTTNLCLASSDETGEKYWGDAVTACTNSTKDGKAAGTWRLPNIAESGQVYNTYASYALEKSTYWTVTTNGNSSWNFDYREPWAYSAPRNRNYYIRCVRNM